MSSGQKAWAEELEEQAARERYDRIAQLGPSTIIKIVDRIQDHVLGLEVLVTSLPRSGWYHLDEAKKELKKLL